jgi:hypothetical protein
MVQPLVCDLTSVHPEMRMGPNNIICIPIGITGSDDSARWMGVGSTEPD